MKKIKLLGDLNLRKMSLLLISVHLLIAPSMGNDNRVILSSNQMSLSELLHIIQKQTGYQFIFFNGEVKNPELSMDLSEGTVQTILDNALKDTGLIYLIKDQTIIIMKKPEDKDQEQPSTPQLPCQNIKGKVTDHVSGISLPGANVLLLGNGKPKGCITDKNGFFKLEAIPVGRHNLKITFVGYEDVVIKEVLVGSAKEVVLHIQMQESLENIEEVVVRADRSQPRNQMALVGARSFNVEDAKRYAASIEDPSRMALSFAGVANGDDITNEIIIRGNSPDKLLWRIEGIEVPSPNHFAEEGTSSGGVSILSSNTMDKSDFFTGAFPAEYGNALSGVFDIQLRNGNAEQTEFAFQFGFLGTDLSIEGPLGKGQNSSYLFNYRYSTLDMFDKLGIDIAGDFMPSFQNINYKLNLKSKNMGHFSIWGIGGTDSEQQDAIADSSEWKSEEDLSFSDEVSNYMYAAGIRHTYFLKHNAYVKSGISISGAGSQYKLDTLNYEYAPVPNARQEFNTYNIAFHVLYNKKINKKLSMRFGGQLTMKNYNYFEEGLTDNGQWFQYVNCQGLANIYQAFIQGNYRLSEKIELNAGLHYVQFSLNKQQSLEPRFGFHWQLAPRHGISGGFGLHSRHDPLLVYFAQEQDESGNYFEMNQDLKLPKAYHAVLAYKTMLGPNTQLKIEGYYQHLFNYSVAKDSAYTYTSNEIDLKYAALTSDGIAYNIGLELSLEKYFSNSYYFTCNTSLFESKYQAADKRWYNSRFNKNYIINFIGGKEFKTGKTKKDLLGLNTKLIWSGGSRDTPVDEASSESSSNNVLFEKQRNTIQYKAYLRLDIGISYRINRSKVSHIVSFDVQNLLNRQNLFRREYYADSGYYEDIFYAGSIPILNYKIEF